MNTFLPPIEHPHGLILKLAYHFTRRQFGKVLTPLKVHSARLPAAFGLFRSEYIPPPDRTPARVDPEAGVSLYPPAIRKGAYALESPQRAVAGCIRSLLLEDRQAGQETDIAGGDGHAHPRTGRAHQRLPVLHGYRPGVHHQSVNEPGKVRRTGSVPNE